LVLLKEYITMHGPQNVKFCWECNTARQTALSLYWQR